MTKTAAVYARVSDTSPGYDGSSLETQTVASIAHAEAHGYKVTHVLNEQFTGTELNHRPQMEILWDLVRTHQVDCVVAYCLDRLSRADPIDALILHREFTRLGVTLLYVTEVVEDSPIGQLITYVRGFVSQQELQKIRERTMRGKKSRALNGKLIGGNKALFGFFYDNVTGTRSVNVEEADVVRRIFAWVQDGVSLRQVTERLNAAGVPPPSSAAYGYRDGHQPRWHRSSVVRICSDPAYTGRAYAYRWRAQRRQGGKTIVSARDPSEWIAMPEGNTPAIITEEIFEHAQRVLTENHDRAATFRNQARPYLLRGFLKCAMCGRRLSPAPDRGVRIYRCRSRDYGASCGATRIRADVIEAEVWAELQRFWRDPRVTLGAEARLGPDPLVSAQLAEQRRRVTDFEHKQARLVTLFANGDASLPMGVIERQLRQLEVDKAAAAGRVAELEARLAEQRQTKEKLDLIERYMRGFAKMLDRPDAWTFEERRQVLLNQEVEIEANGREWRLTGLLATEAADTGVAAGTTYRSRNNAHPQPPNRISFSLRARAVA